MLLQQSLLLLAVVVFLSQEIHAQHRTYPKAYTPSTGDTLDAVEPDYYRLFEAIEGFQIAAFFLNATGSLQQMSAT